MWPKYVARPFEIIPANPSASDYTGPYNKLLCVLFTDCAVASQCIPDPDSKTDFMMMFQVSLMGRPIFVLELAPPSYIDRPLKRQAADHEIRSRMTDVVKRCTLPTLHAVSAIGTRLCFYSLETGGRDARIMPAAIPHDPLGMNDKAPKCRWDCDIMGADGEDRLRSIAQGIMQGIDWL